MWCLPPQPWFMRFAKKSEAGVKDVFCEEGMWLAFDLNIRRGGSLSERVASGLLL
jgi:alpha-mannosidase